MRLRNCVWPTLTLALACTEAPNDAGPTTGAGAGGMAGAANAGQAGATAGAGAGQAGGAGGCSNAVAGGGSGRVSGGSAGAGGRGGMAEPPGPMVDRADPQLFSLSFSAKEADDAAAQALGKQNAFLDTRVEPL